MNFIVRTKPEMVYRMVYSEYVYRYSPCGKARMFSSVWFSVIWIHTDLFKNPPFPTLLQLPDISRLERAPEVMSQTSSLLPLSGFSVQVSKILQVGLYEISV